MQTGALGQFVGSGVDFAVIRSPAEQAVNLVEVFVGGSVAVDQPLLQPLVLGGKEQQAFGGQTVAPGPAGFLVIGLHRGRQVVMNDRSHVRFVHPHAKSIGCDHDLQPVGHKIILDLLALVAVQSRMISPGRNANGAANEVGNFVRIAAGGGVDDGAARAFAQQGGQGLQLGPGVGGELDPEGQVGPVEAGDDGLSLSQPQQFDNIFLNRWRGGGGRRQ